MKKNASEEIRDAVTAGETALGIELGSTRIKAVLTGPDHRPLATGEHAWENQLREGVWTYDLEAVTDGLQACYADLCKNLEASCGAVLKRVGAIGISGMMHGYLVFDTAGQLLVPFRTWRNNITGQAAGELTELFQYPIAQRWSIAHLDQAILNGEAHVGRIAHITTLAGHVHWKLTGRKVLGVGEASGMFPIDIERGDFDRACIGKYNERIARKGLDWRMEDVLPEVLCAGEDAGTLTAEGARWIDPSGELEAGIPLCPPEGDAGTGMVATNSVEARTGNVSAGTSVFAMLVLEKALSKLHPEIDLVTTPDGKPVAMAHANNCTSDLNAWMGLLGEAARVLGADADPADLYGKLLPLALEGDADGGGLLAYGYVSGEHVTGFSEGRPLFARRPDSSFTLANFLRTHLFSALCALRAGLNILTEEEHVRVDEIRGHGGFFKTASVGQRVMAAATETPVSVLETAGEGGAWGIALLAAYRIRRGDGQSLPDFLKPVFAGSLGEPLPPEPNDVEGFRRFFERYRRGLAIERAAVDALE